MSALALNLSAKNSEKNLSSLDLKGGDLSLNFISQLKQFGLDPRDWQLIARRSQVALIRHRHDHWFQFKAYLSPSGRIRQLHLLDF